MSYKITIVDNKTGKTVADYAEALGIMGGIILADSTVGIDAARTDMLHRAALVETVQKLLQNTVERDPRLALIGCAFGDLVEKDREERR